MFNPKVSIVIPVYNGSNYVREAIDSALAQTYKNIEVIVINDGSTDNEKTDEICKSYGDKIKYFAKENGGVASALNMGIEKMSGEYFSWLSHDDIYYPEKVEKQIDVLSKFKDKTTIVYSRYEIIGPNGELIIQPDFKAKYKSIDLNKPLYPFFHLILNGCAMLISKELLEKVEMFDKGLPSTQDYDLWFRLLSKNNVVYHDDIILKSRSHDAQGSKASITEHIEECNNFWIRVFSLVSREEMTMLEGSVLNFYKNMYQSFKELTLYNEVISYLEGKVLDEIVVDYENEKSRPGREKIIDEIITKVYGEKKEKMSLEEMLKYTSKPKKRILFFTGNWHDRGGLNRVISIISSTLVVKYDVVVCCLREEGNSKGYDLDKRVKFVEIDSSEFPLLPKLLRILKVDVFIGSNNCFDLLLNMYEEIESLGTKVIMWNHESYFEPFYDSNLHAAIEIRRKVYKKVTANLWLSNLGAIMGKQFARNTLVMGNPVSINIPSVRKKNDENLALISMARFDSPRKRIDRLIEIYAQVLKKRAELKLYIVGKYNLEMKFNDQETISQLIKRLNIPEDKIVFTGEIKDVESYYQKALINIVPSEREGFGLTVLESAQFGLPSVVFSDGGAAEIITDGVDGYVVEEGNIEKMAARITNLLNNTSLYSEMSVAVDLLAKKYRKEAIVEKWINLLDAVLYPNSSKLQSLFDEESTRLEGVYDKNFMEIINLYEGALEKQNIEIGKTREDTIYSKLLKPLRKFNRLVELIKIQGIRITTRNILLKIKAKILK